MADFKTKGGHMRNIPALDPGRVRKITGSFSWLDHRLLTQGFLATLTAHEMLVYFFLVLVGDRAGISFYSYDKLCTLLKIDVDTLLEARAGLVAKSLIAFEEPHYQVLQLPARPVVLSDACGREPHRAAHAVARGEFHALAEIFEHLHPRA
jgi:hypothetical protein